MPRANKDTTLQEVDSPWEKFLRAENIPVYRGFAIEDLTKSKLAPWKRYGANGAYVYLDGAGGITTGFILEVAPGQKTTPVRHMYESRVVVLTGEGETHFWQEGGKKVTAHFKHGTLFPFPLNVWYEIVNTGKEPARMYGVGWAPMAIDFFRDLTFIFNNNHNFMDRFDGRLDFFRPEPAEMNPNRHDGLGYAVSVTNLVPDVDTVKLYPAGHGVMETAWRQAGGSGTVNRHSRWRSITWIPTWNSSSPRFTNWARHGPGANVMYLGGHGYSLIWPPRSVLRRSRMAKAIKWFASNGVPTRFCSAIELVSPALQSQPNAGAISQSSRLWKPGANVVFKVVFQEYPIAIDYQAEDPQIRKMFEQECIKNGVNRSCRPSKSYVAWKEEKEKQK